MPPGYATAIFPAAGVALAALLLYGAPSAAGVWLGSFAMNLAVAYQGSGQVSGTAAALAATIGVGSTLQALAGAWLVRRAIGFPNALDGARDIGLFLVLGGPLSCLVSATTGVSSLVFYGAIASDQYLHTWSSWWVGDTIGVLVATPLVLAVLGRPPADWRPRRAALLVPPVALLIASVALFLLASRWEEERLRAEFHQRANVVADRLEAGFGSHLQVLRAIESLYASSTEVERHAFRRFVQTPLREFPGLAALSWNAFVRDAERASFEAAVRREGYAGFQITERDAQGGLRPAARRDEYIVVTFIEPHAGNGAALGYDIGSDARRREAIERARDSGAVSATARIRLVQERQEQWGALLLQPVYRDGTMPADVQSRRRTLQGFAVGVVRMGHLVQVAVPEAERASISVRFLDASAPHGEQTLYETSPGAPTAAVDALRFERAFQAAGRTYRIVALPTAGYLATHPAWVGWAVFAGSLLFCGLLQAFLLLVTGRAARIGLLVEERTSELSESRERLALALEGSQRLSAELERRVAQRTRELEGAVGALRRANHEAGQLGELSELLQTCATVSEAGEIASRFCPQFFPGAPGAVYVLAPSKDGLERVATWGEPAPAGELVPEDCWALRRGRVHHAQESGIALACAHARPEAAQALCVPLNAQGTALGLLHLEDGAAEERLARLLGERLSLALANLRLREALRDQSIRDALTGLHNRRYLEESMERELSRASRAERPLAVFMLDVDHFKKYNDRYGHDGGDAALRALGRLLKGACRASDLACRFGGEEFTVVLPDTDAAAATAWAERLMADVRALKVKSGERALEGITISMGLALFPENGSEAETLLQAADLALYEAKHAGRDRLAVAPPGAERRQASA